MVWCLMTRWPGGYLAYHLIYNRTATYRLFGLCLILVIFFTLFIDYKFAATSLYVGRWSLFINTPYALTSKFVLIFFVAISLLNRVVTNEYTVYSFMLLLFGMLLLDTSHLLSLYVCLEGLSLVSYGLIALGGTIGNAEAAIKYYLFGSISSALFAYGVSVEYLLIHSIDFAFIKLGVLTGDFDFVTTLYAILIVCIVSAYLYKLALFPFHFILPDVYSGIS